MLFVFLVVVAGFLAGHCDVIGFFKGCCAPFVFGVWWFLFFACVFVGFGWFWACL